MTVLGTEIISSFLNGLRPTPRVTPTQWADKYRYLSSVSSAEPGRWRTSRTPYLQEVMDHFSVYSPVEEVVVMKGAQIGFTETGLNIVGYYIDNDPGPVMYVMPTIETMQRNVKMRFDPMFNATPRLSEKISEKKSRDSANTMKQKDFPGGTLILAGGNSAASLRSVPVRVLILDEVDGYPSDLDGEGSPVELAKARTRTFSRKKIFMLSTPTVEGQSVIAKEFEETSQRYYFVPCPHCGHFQRLVWDNVKWDKGYPRSAKYLCEACEKLIEERYKPMMLKKGKWQEAKPENTSSKKVGYHLNSLYSPLGWYSWGDAAQSWIDAQGKPDELKVFINTVLGETWKESGEVPEWEALYDRRMDYPTNRPNNEIALITCGVDVQKDRLELELVGWTKGKKSYSIDYRVIFGPTSENQVWEQLALVVGETWEREDGVLMPLSKMAVDTGYNTNMVYKFCRRFPGGSVIPIKGQDRQNVVVSTPIPVDRTKKGKKAGSLGLYSIGVSILKGELYGWLKAKRNENGEFPDGYCFFPNAYDEHFFKMLTAEQLQKEVVKGFTKYVWVKVRERNEALDCFDAQTQVLTKGGWKYFHQVGEGEELATVNLEGNVLEYQKPSALIAKPYKGDMLSIKGKRLDIMATPNHRMVVNRKKKIGGKWRFDLPSFVKLAKEMDIHDQVLTAPGKWIGENSGFLKIPSSHKADNGQEIEPDRMVSKLDLAAFMGWFVSEGGVSKTKFKGSFRRRVEIAQSKKHSIESIAKCLEKLPWHFRVDQNNGENIKFVCTSKQLFDFTKCCGHGTFEKRVPQWIKDAGVEIIKAFLDAAIEGDGHSAKKMPNHRPFRKYYTVSKYLADDIQELFLKIGKASNIYEIPEKEWEIRGKKGISAKQYHVSEINNTKASLDGGGNGKREYLGKMVAFEGMVYCATVPNGTLIVRRNGKAFVCGNCRIYARAAAAVVGIDRFKDHHWEGMIKSRATSNPIATKPAKGSKKSPKKRESSFW